MLRSIGAVLLGWMAVGLLVVCSDGVLAKLYPNDYVSGKMPPDWLSAISLATSTVWSVVGGWITARIAKDRPWHHLLGLVVWGEIMGVASTIISWNLMQHWYSIGLLVLWVPAVVIGGWIRAGKPTLSSPAQPA